MKYSYVSNNCLAQIIYFSESREYDSPFIGSIFLNDYQYVKLCKNYEYYLSLKPVFGEPKRDSVWDKQNNGIWYKHIEIIPGYRVMFLDDIEIHWIHENDINLLLEKYNRRIQRYKKNVLTPLFMLSFSDLCNDHSQDDYNKLVDDFTSIENSIYLTKYKDDIKDRYNVFLIKDWIPTVNDRNYSHIYKFHSISKREEYFKVIIRNKLSDISLKYSIIMPLKINTLNSFKIFTEISLPLYNKFLETEYIDYFYIICPDTDIPAISKYTDKYPNIPFKVIPESLILHENMGSVDGWLKQQIIKLSISSVIKTKHYLILDSDLYLNQPFVYKDLFNECKIKYSYEPWQTENGKLYSTNSKWWESSCNILSYQINNLHGQKELMGVTPQTMITQKVIDLLMYIKKMHGKNWQKTICDMKFTEYTLYWIFLLMNNDTSLYTISGKALWKHDLTRNILHYHSEDEQKNIITRSICDRDTYFSVIQSYLPVNIDVMKMQIFKNNKKEYDAIFLISSTVTPTQLKFFSVEERYLQTLETVKSARKYFPNSLCILIEGSILSDKHKNELIKNFDHILEFGENEEVLAYTRNIINIGHGEQKLLEKGIEFIQNNILSWCTTKFIFKLGARYVLSNKFNILNYNENKYNFYEEFDVNGKSLEVYTTGLYSIPINLLDIFKTCLINVHKHLSVDTDMIERYFYEHIPKEEVNIVKILGLEGRLNYNGTFFSK